MMTPHRWQQQLQAFGQPNDHATWLELHFHPGWERWVVYQCMPKDKTNWFVRMRPASGTPELNLDRHLVDRVQWHLYQTRGVYASPYWVIQGSMGGHRRRLWPYEQQLAQIGGLPKELPDPGDLPFALFDQRVMDQLHRLDAVAMWNKMLEFTDRNESSLDQDEEQARVDVLRSLSKWVQEQTTNHFHGLSSAELSSITNELPTGLERGSVKGFDFEQWFEETLLPRQRIGKA